jgi:hypothetical protein
MEGSIQRNRGLIVAFVLLLERKLHARPGYLMDLARLDVGLHVHARTSLV